MEVKSNEGLMRFYISLEVRDINQLIKMLGRSRYRKIVGLTERAESR